MKKKSKKSNKNTKKRTIKKMRVIIFFAVIIVSIYLLLNLDKILNKKTASMDTLITYMSYINEGKYEEMYEMISDTSKAKIEKEAFIKRNEEVYNEIEANNVRISDMSEEDENRKNKNHI